MGEVGNEMQVALERLYEALGRPVFEIDPAERGEAFIAAVVDEATRRIRDLPLVEWPRVRTIATLPNAKLTPQVVLARTLEKATHGKLKSVYIGLQWAANDHFTYDYSHMALTDLSMHKLMLEYRLQNVAFGSVDDESMSPAAP